MKLAMVAMIGLVILGGTAPAMAQATGDKMNSSKAENESGTIFTTILRIVVNWIFPISAAYCFLYGIVGRGVKRGEWDMAAICTIGAIALALFPKLLTGLFNISL